MATVTAAKQASPATKINKHTAMLNCYFSSLIKRDQTSPTAIKAL
jgi:hypothetical protein